MERWQRRGWNIEKREFRSKTFSKIFFSENERKFFSVAINSFYICLMMMTCAILTANELINSVNRYFLSTFYVSVRRLGDINTEMSKAYPLLKNLWSNNHINYVSNIESYIRR